MLRKVNQRIKIVYVIGQLTIGGTERQLLALLQNLDIQRFEPYVICLSDEQMLLQEQFSQLMLPVYILGRDRKGRLRTLWDMYLLLRKISPDLVHVFSYALRAAIPASKLVGKSKLIVSFRTDPKRWVTFFDRLLINTTNLILENSTGAMLSYQAISQHSSIPPGKVVYNGIDLPLFDKAMQSEIDPFIRTLPGQRYPIICAVSTLRPVKHLSLLIEAFALLQKRLPKVCLWIVGDGEEREKLEILASDLGVKSSIFFCGIRKDVPTILSKASLGVLSSKHEGFPNVILEYMSACLPVVATDVGGNREVVVDGQTGLLIPFGDPHALADAMLYFLQNPDVARQFGEAGRRRVEENFTIERMVRETESIYEKLMESGKC